MKKTILFLLVFLLAVSGFSAKRRIAVMDLEDKAQGQHGGWRSVGSGMADAISTGLVKSGKFNVLERSKLEKLMQEQKLGASGAVTAQSAAKIGQLLGVQYMIMGSVTEFGVKESKLGVGGLGGLIGIGGGIDTRTNTARVAMDVRMIDTSTGEIILAEKGEGEESSTGVSVNLSVAPSVDFGKDGFDETVIGKAVRKAIEHITEVFAQAEAKMPWSAKIIKVDGRQIWLNSGEEDGTQVGKEISIFKKGEDLIDPDTGASLGSSDTKLGVCKITKVDKKFSIAETTVTGVTKDNYLKEEK